MNELRVGTERNGGHVTLRVSGELDIGSAGDLERAMRRAERSDCRELLLDLGGLRFIDSTGLRLIISAQGRAEEGGWGFALIPGPEQVHRVFRIAGLESRLPFTEGKGDAAAAD